MKLPGNPDGSLRGEGLHDRDAGAGTDAAGSGFKHGACVVEGADSARGLHAAARSGYTAQQGYIGSRRAVRGEAGAGLKEIGARGAGNFRGAQLLFGREQAGFKDYFNDRSRVVPDLDHTMDILLEQSVFTRLQQADVDDHIELS